MASYDVAGFICPLAVKLGDTSGCIRFEDAAVAQSIMAVHGGESAEQGALEIGGKPAGPYTSPLLFSLYLKQLEHLIGG